MCFVEHLNMHIVFMLYEIKEIIVMVYMCTLHTVINEDAHMELTTQCLFHLLVLLHKTTHSITGYLT